jgi:hypothetical protein
MSDTKLVSFTVNKETWEAFKILASEQGRSASNCLNQLIEQALHKNDITLTDDGDITPISPIDFVSRSEFDQALNDLKSQIEDLEQKINHPTGFNMVSEPSSMTVQRNSPKPRNNGDRRQKILELMGYIPTCPQCGNESISKEGHGKGKSSHRFRCVNVDCSRQTFTAYPNNLGYL